MDLPIGEMKKNNNNKRKCLGSFIRQLGRMATTCFLPSVDRSALAEENCRKER